MPLLSPVAAREPSGLLASATPRRSVGMAQSLARQQALERKARSFRVPLGDLARFTQQLSALLAAGLPLVQCLDALQEQVEHPCFRIIIREVRSDIAQGNPFSAAVRRFPRAFNPLFIAMVEAGEASGALAEILGRVAGYFESTVKLAKKVKSAMVYPIAVIGLAVVLVAVLLIFVIPVFAGMFASAGAKLPGPTQALIDFSDFLRGWWWALLLGGGALGWLGRRLVATPAGRRAFDAAIIRLPVAGAIIHKVALSRFCRTYAALVRAGVPILRVLEIVAAAGGRAQIEAACGVISRHLSAGGQVSEALEGDPYFPATLRHMVKAGEATGNVDGMLNKLADFYDHECETGIAGLTSLIEPALIVFLGVVIGGIVMAMFLPIFQMGSVVAAS